MKNYSYWFESTPDRRRFPRLAGDREADVVVIGGSIGGLFTAFFLAGAGLRVVVLERSKVAGGDAAYSTGFVTRVPSEVSFASFAAKYGEFFLRRLFAFGRSIERRIFSLIQQDGIPCEFKPCDAFFGGITLNDLTVRREWSALERVDPDADFFTRNQPHRFPFASAVQFSGAAKCNIRKYLIGRAEVEPRQLFDCFEDSQVVSLELCHQNSVCVRTPTGTVRAGSAILAVGDPSALLLECGALVAPFSMTARALQYEQLSLPEDIFWDAYEPRRYFRKISEDELLIACADDRALTGRDDRTASSLSYLFPLSKSHGGITHQWSYRAYATIDGLPYFFEHPKMPRVWVMCGFGAHTLVWHAAVAEIAAALVRGKTHDQSDLFSLDRTGAKLDLLRRKPREPIILQSARGVVAIASHNPLRRLYAWTLHWAHTRHAERALWFLSFIESSFFPVPPDVLMIPMVIARPDHAWRIASICTAASVLGAVAGYVIGWGFFETVGNFIVETYHLQAAMDNVGGRYQSHAFLSIFSAAFTPIPFKVFTLSAGVFKIPLILFIIASILGRGGRFFAVAWALKRFGVGIQKTVEKYFNWFSIAFVVLLMAGFFLLGSR